MWRYALCLTFALHAAHGEDAASCGDLWQHQARPLVGEQAESLCRYRGQVVLVVNTASYCGYTPQYKQLETIYQRYRARGFTVVGFPSGDFFQEMRDESSIAEFCERNFGVSFPMYEKTTVTGQNAHPLFRALAAQTGKAPGWNFHKYLVDREGKVTSFATAVRPDAPALIRAIEDAL